MHEIFNNNNNNNINNNKSLPTSVVFKIDSPSHGVDHRFWLLKDLLLHEGAEVSCSGMIIIRENVSLELVKQV